MSESCLIKTDIMETVESTSEQPKSTQDTNEEMKVQLTVKEEFFSSGEPTQPSKEETGVDTKDTIHITNFSSELPPGTENDTDVACNKTEVLKSPSVATNVEDCPVVHRVMDKASVDALNKVIHESVWKQKKRNREKRKTKLRAKRVKVENQSCEASSSQNVKEVPTYMYSSSSDGEDYSFVVSNLPNTWSYLEIKNYLDKQCGHVDEIEMIKLDSSNKYGAIRLSFQSSGECLQAMKKLYKKEIDGNQLVVKMNDVEQSLDSDTETVKTDDLADKKPWRPDLDPWDIDPAGLYGLKVQFLKSLNIKPPIDKWVEVSNFRCDKSELRDVMELAGCVLQYSVFTVGRKYAKVMYHHPLEAVQAISMLNGQNLYGKLLKVTMDNTPSDTVILPKGLHSLGLGLGITGKPIRNIVEHYKRYVNKEDSLINTLIFETVDENTNDETKDDVNFNKSYKMINVGELNSHGVDQERDDSDDSSDETTVKVPSPKPNEVKKPTNVPSASNTPKTASVAENSRPQFGSTGAMGPGLAVLSNPGFNTAPRPTFGPNNFQRPFFPNPGLPARPPGTFGPGPRPFVPGPMVPHPNGIPRQPLNLSGPRQPMNLSGPPLAHNPVGPLNLSGPLRPRGPGGLPDPNLMGAPMARPFPHQMSHRATSSTVEMCNLPPNTTFPLLCERLSHCGQVVSLQFTTPGCAVVSFAQRGHAEVCYQKFNRYTVDGYMIEVKYR